MNIPQSIDPPFWRLPFSPLSPTIHLNFFPAASPTLRSNKPFFEEELDLTSLDDISLYLAGSIEPETLHMQKMKSRDIVITEEIKLHMVYHWNQVYIKPLPRWLLNPSLWKDHLCRSKQFPAALGFLLSYMHLIRHESDFRIAKENFLLPEGLSWKAWLVLANELRTNNKKSVHERFKYGMLSLGRLNLICRCLQFRLINGYLSFLTINFADFLQHNFSYFLTVFVYMTMVLSAMQVGLATNLKDQEIFLRVATGFAIFSIVLPLFVLSGIMLSSIGCCLTMLWEAYSSQRKLRTSGSKSFGSSIFGQWYYNVLSYLGRDQKSPNAGNGLSADNLPV